jgi:hypothetical protein
MQDRRSVLSLASAAFAPSMLWSGRSPNMGEPSSFRGAKSSTFPINSASAQDDRLSWAPPSRSLPVTLDLRGEGITQTDYKFPVNQDVEVLLPENRHLEIWRLQITGGRTVRIIGGGLRAPKVLRYKPGAFYSARSTVAVGEALYQTSNGGTTAGTAPSGLASNQSDGGVVWDYLRRHDRGLLRLWNSAETTFIEGIDLDVNDAWGYDGIQTTSTYRSDIFVQNCRITGVNSNTSSIHADAFQFYGPAGRLYIDKLTVATQYQGLFLSPQYPVGGIDLRRVDLRYTRPDESAGYLLWLFDNEAQARHPVSISEVFVEDRGTAALSGKPESYVVWPASPQAGSIGATRQGDRISWPSIPEINGEVVVGQSTSGSFVPAGTAGPGYRSPGYRETLSI